MKEKEIVVNSRTIRRPIFEYGRTLSIPQEVAKVKVGEEEITFGAYITMVDLDYLAHRAARNKSGKARDGALTVEIHARRRVG